MNEFQNMKDTNIFIEYSKKKSEFEAFQANSISRIQEMNEIAFAMVRHKVSEAFYDVRLTGVRYQLYLNKVYEGIPIAHKHPHDMLVRTSFGGEEVMCESHSSDGKKAMFRVTYDELVMSDREYKAHIRKIIAQAEKEALKEKSCLCMKDVEPMQAIIDKQRDFFDVFEGWKLQQPA